jgi:hypothetical protein
VSYQVLGFILFFLILLQSFLYVKQKVKGKPISQI